MRIPSSYSLKPLFQQLLLPVSNWCVKQGIRPNAITLFSFVVCVCCSILLIATTTSKIMLFFLPLVLLFKIILNALDGMVAKTAGQQTPSGELLNEWCDYFADLILFVAILFVLPAYTYLWALLLVLLILTQLVSVVAAKNSGVRMHIGPFCKSDRAVYLAIGAVLIGYFNATGYALLTYILLGTVLALITLLVRLQKPVKVA